MRSAKTRTVRSEAKAAAALTPVIAAAAPTLAALPNAGDATPFGGLPDWLRYAIDASKRGALFMQALVERGDTILEDERTGLPLRLKFPFQVVLRICECCHADLRRLKSPMLVFASSGDNVTPPQQALGWVPAVWRTTQALIAGGQRIVYLLNPSVGHLGIFVSADVARREHRAILDNLDALESLDPGLYEMRILESTGAVDCLEPQYRVSFEARRVEDLPKPQNSAAFERVRELSEATDMGYQRTLGPVARTIGGTALASFLKWTHPMRASRLAWAHAFNPFAYGIDMAAAWAGATRTPLAPDSAWAAAESRAMDACSGVFDDWRRQRDAATETLFATLFNARDRAGAVRPRSGHAGNDVEAR